jgi:hypothetical protein
MKKPVESGTVRFDYEHDTLILSFAAEDLMVCAECLNLHIRLTGLGKPENIRGLAAGLLHFADHVETEQESEP